MSGRKKALGVFLIVFVYIVIALLGFFIVYYVKTTGHPPEIKTPLPKVTPAPVPSGFKTYENTKQKIALSYPSTLQVKENSYGMGVSTVEMRSAENTNKQDAPDVQMLTVPKTMAMAIGQDFDAYYAMADNTTKLISSPLNGSKTAENFTKVQNRNINGMRAFEYSSVPQPNPNNQEAEIGVFIETGSELTIFATGENDRAQLETMLTTFTYPSKSN